MCIINKRIRSHSINTIFKAFESSIYKAIITVFREKFKADRKRTVTF